MTLVEGGVTDSRRHAIEQLQGTLYRSTESCSFNGSTEFNITFTGFGQDTFIWPRNKPKSWSGWVKYEGPADPGSQTLGGQVIFGRWYPTPTSAINEGGHRCFLASDALSGNPLVTRAMHVNVATNIFNGLWIYTRSSFPLDEWVHVAVTWEGVSPYLVSDLKIYWDGVLQPVWVAAGNWTSNAMASNQWSHLIWGAQYTCWFGGGALPDNPPTLRRYFEGHMDEWCMWNHELTATEVLALYGSSATPLTGAGVARHGAYITQPDQARSCNRWHRMGEGRDGTPWIFGFTICYGYNPVNGFFGNMFVQAGAGRMPIQDTVNFP